MGFGRFGFLLLALVFFLVTTPFAEHTPAAEVRFQILFSLVLVVGVYTMSSRQSMIRAAVLALVAFATGAVHTVDEGIVSTQVAYATSIAFLGYVTFVVLSAVLQERRVTTDTIFGGICVYFLIGLIWTLLYALVLAFDPEALQAGGQPVSYELERGSSVLLYFSFVTLTTLGYGDVAPVSDVARMLAGGEAVFGQLFIAILIARLVGMHISTTHLRRHED